MTISARQLLSAYLFGWLVIMTVGYFIKGDGPLFNGYSLVVCVGLTAVLLISLQTKPRSIFIPCAYLVISLGISALPRLVGYLLFPELCTLPLTLSDFSKEIVFTVDQINISLVFILLGTAGIVIGFFIGDQIFDRWSRTPSPRSGVPISIGSFLVIFIAISLLEFFLLFGLNVHVFKEQKGGWHYAIMAVRVLFSIDIAFFFAFGLLLYKEHKSRWERVLLYIIPILYGLYITAGASKGAAFRIIFYLLALLLCKSGNFKVKTMRLAIFIPFLVGVSIPAYYLGLVARLHQIKGSSEINLSDAVQVASGTKAQDISIPFLLAPILDRLGDIDYAVTIIALPDSTRGSKYLTLAYVLKSTVNMMVPGTIFPEAELSTARAMPMIFRDMDEAHVKQGEFYNNETWTAWGIAHAHFGWAGLIFLTVCAACFHYGFRWLDTTAFSDPVRFVLKGWYLFVVIRASFFYNMGLDYSFFTGLVALVQWYLIYIAACWVEWRRQEWEEVVVSHRVSSSSPSVSRIKEVSNESKCSYSNSQSTHRFG